MRLGTNAASAVLLAACLSVGCTQRDCTAIGAEPGVSFDLRQVVADESRRVHVPACVRDICVEHFASSGRWETIFINDPSLTGPRTVTVRLVVTNPSGRKILDERADVDVRRFQPNGPGCDPIVYTASVEATTDGHLESQSVQSE
jgi:hypothetical protein